MKKFLFVFITTILIITGGWLIVKEIQKKELLTENAPLIEKYLKYNYEGIKSVTFSEVKVNPTGIPHIIGYVNNDKDTYFSAGIYNEKFDGDIGVSNIPMTDNNLEFGAKSVSDIEKEEKNK
ncbi:DUF1433 domain-containing protein [Carnobacterium maltaromaticum]|uniref:DUF1433 domain-containing protein n=1 Tax=Carnobacterium maltaromaticum TaxID=2751 RepID=UPI00295E3F6F|nr:DUF1433 domain-containing protein [Carnobacterium maltaromaticum]